jgi:hypothetical protein
LNWNSAKPPSTSVKTFGASTRRTPRKGAASTAGREYEETQYTIAEWNRQDSLKNKLAIAELAALLTGGNGNG